jgi:hypothetical protein
MARLLRIVIPHVPHHVTQRGNRHGLARTFGDLHRGYTGIFPETGESRAIFLHRETTLCSHRLFLTVRHPLLPPQHARARRTGMLRVCVSSTKPPPGPRFA